MGTRSLIEFREDGKVLATVYRQFDGYPSGRGLELADWLAHIELINGIGAGQTAGTHANGAGCLVAQWIAAEKGDEIGGVYILAPGTRDAGEEYTYVVDINDDKIKLSAYGYGKLIFEGDPASFDASKVEDAA